MSSEIFSVSQLEGDEQQQIQFQEDDINILCCRIITSIIVFVGVTVVVLSIIILDIMQIGTIQYKYHVSNYSNIIKCGHKTISISCADTNICNDLGQHKLNRIDVNTSYDIFDANLYYICTYIGCIVPYILLILLWLLRPNRNATCCSIKIKNNCFLLCCLSMIVSIIAVAIGITLTVETQNCSQGLYVYLQSKLNGEYQWNINDTPQMRYGMTLIFMMITVGITMLFTIWFGICIVRSSNNKRKSSNKYIHFLEGIEKRFSAKTTKYGSANTAKFSINQYDEGYH